MFTHLTKSVSSVGLTRRRKLENGIIRFVLTSSVYRQNEKKPNMKPCQKTGSGRGFYKALGAVILGTGAVVVIARNNDDFRDWLKDNVPGSDEFISFVAAERTTRIDYIMRKMEDFGKQEKIETDSSLGKVFAAIRSGLTWLQSIIEEEQSVHKPSILKPPCDEEGKPYNPKKAVEKRMKEIDEDKEAEQEERKKELEELEAIELAKKKKKDKMEGKNGVAGPPKKTKDEVAKVVTENLEIATKAYTDAICFLMLYIDTVKEVVESSVEKQDPKIWPALQKRTMKADEKVKKLMGEASKAEADAQRSFKELNDPKREDKISEEERANYEEKFKSLKHTREEFIRQRNMAGVTNTYWTLVKQSREHFQEQIGTLFPDLSVSNKSMKLAEAELDLFILCAFQTILHYQNELDKLDMMSKANVKAALEKSKMPEQIECVMEQELAKEKEKICEEYKKKLQALKADCEKKMNDAIKNHNAMHTEMLQEALDRKEEEVMKKMKRQMDEQLVQEKQRYREEMAGLLGRLKGMDELMKKRAIQEKQAVDSMLLWSACEGLVSAITCERDCAAVTMRSLGPEIRAIQLAASKDDVLVQAVVKAIPQIAYDRGIFGEPALKERFTNTARVAKRVALLPEGGASLPMMFISYILSILVTSPTIPIPCSELSEKPINPKSLNTFEILQFAKYWMDRGDWYQVLRYMNLLKGAPRVVAQDFLDEVKIFLETKQAADVLIAHASVSAIAT